MDKSRLHKTKKKTNFRFRKSTDHDGFKMKTALINQPAQIFVVIFEKKRSGRCKQDSEQFCVVCFFRLRGQDYQFCLQVGGKGWKVTVIFASFSCDLFFLVFAGENFQAEPLGKNTERRTFFFTIRGGVSTFCCRLIRQISASPPPSRRLM